MTQTAICPCDQFIHPGLIFNPPGLSLIRYRSGDFIAFRHALLIPLSSETELLNWRPRAKTDLGVQLVEWWAVVADILTFYNERIANESYIRTALLPEDVNRLIRILGYRPRPGIGATGQIAALMNSAKPFLIGQGFQIQSKPGPGKQPQIFEVDTDTRITAPDAIDAAPLPDTALIRNGGVLLKGVITSVKAGQTLLLMQRGWSGADNNYAPVVVQEIKPEKDPNGKTNTRVVLTSVPAIFNNAQASQYRLLRSAQSAAPWSNQVGGSFSVIESGRIHMASLVRDVKVGDPVFLETTAACSILRAGVEQVEFLGGRPRRLIRARRQLTAPAAQLVSINGYSESVFYANPDGPAFDPSKAPANPPNIPVPIPHSILSFTPALTGSWNSFRQNVVVRFAWQDAGEVIGTPATTFSGTSSSLAAAVLPAGVALPAMIEGADGTGENATVSATPPDLTVGGLPDPPLALAAPLRVMFNLLPVSRGKTVLSEVLGSGDAGAPAQEFVLQKSPLTYLPGPATASGAAYRSTLRVWVNDIEWKEAPSFYGQSATARVFVTREDDQNKTHVLFGDGVNGARLPSGVNNVVATYRFGSGADSPEAGALTIIVQPQPGLKAIRNPVGVGGGADPDPPSQIRRYAPRSVLSFGRVVSSADHETVAAQTPGVSRARAYWSFDASRQVELVTVYVGDTEKARSDAETALTAAGDPNRPPLVKLAKTVSIQLTLTILVDPLYVPKIVVAAAAAALVDPDAGLFGVNVIRIGQTIFDSQIFAACLRPAGATAVHSLRFLRDASGNGVFQEELTALHDPGEGAFFQLAATALTINYEVAPSAL